MPDEPLSPSIHTKYSEQLAADLAANRARQAELTGLLDQLQQEEKWYLSTLESMPAAAPDVPASPAPVSSADQGGDVAEEVGVPQPRAEKAGSGAATKAPAKKATGTKRAAKKAPVKNAPVKENAPAKKTAARKTAKAQGPTLGALLKQLLSQQPGEPKKVSEIRAELELVHPERATSDQVVRNTLERLVAKSMLERDNRQGVVLYTWPVPGDAPAAAAGAKDEEPAEALPARV